MSTATATKKQGLQKVSLREDWARNSAPLKVDREKGIIYGVKMGGLVSSNGRRYLIEAFQKSLTLYEGSKAYTDHPSKPTDSRKDDDALGVWRSVRLQPDGPYGDLHYFRSHPMADRICEDAERGMGVFGASHNADGKGEYVDGVFVINEITEVRSVDIVTDPATVSNLWESKKGGRIKVTLKKLLETKVLPVFKGKDQRAPILKKLLEDDSMDDYEIDEPEAGEDFRDHLFSAFKAIQGEDPGIANKILAMLKMDAKPTEEDDAGDDKDKKKVEEEDSADDKEKEKVKEGADCDKGMKKTPESRRRSSKETTDPAVKELQEQVAKLTQERDQAQLKQYIREGCESRGITADKYDVKAWRELLESLESIPTREAIAKHLDWLKANAPRQSSKGPRSQPPSGSRPIPESKPAKDSDSFLEAITLN